MRIPSEATRAIVAVVVPEYQKAANGCILLIKPRKSIIGRETANRNVATIGAPIHDIIPS